MKKKLVKKKSLPKKMTPSAKIERLKRLNSRKSSLLSNAVHEIFRLRRELQAVTKSRDTLAKLVDPKVVIKVQSLEDRNFKLELILVLTRQMAKAIRHSWTKQGYPTDAVDAFEDDLKRILGENDVQSSSDDSPSPDRRT